MLSAPVSTLTGSPFWNLRMLLTSQPCVNAFGPGFMETEAILNRHDWNNGRKERVLAQTPMGRVPAPEELAAAALFLATDDAAHMTGNFIMCDGGYSMIGA